MDRLRKLRSYSPSFSKTKYISLPDSTDLFAIHSASARLVIQESNGRDAGRSTCDTHEDHRPTCERSASLRLRRSSTDAIRTALRVTRAARSPAIRTRLEIPSARPMGVTRSTKRGWDAEIHSTATQVCHAKDCWTSLKPRSTTRLINSSVVRRRRWPSSSKKNRFPRSHSIPP